MSPDMILISIVVAVLGVVMVLDVRKELNCEKSLYVER